KPALRINLDLRNRWHRRDANGLTTLAVQPWIDRKLDVLDRAVRARDRKQHRHRREATIRDDDRRRVATFGHRLDRLIERPRLEKPGRPEPREVTAADLGHRVEEVVRVRMLADPSAAILTECAVERLLA